MAHVAIAWLLCCCVVVGGGVGLWLLGCRPLLIAACVVVLLLLVVVVVVLLLLPLPLAVDTNGAVACRVCCLSLLLQGQKGGQGARRHEHHRACSALPLLHRGAEEAEVAAGDH